MREKDREIIIMGDLNARVERRKGTEGIVGRNTAGNALNKAGRILIEFCRELKLKISSTFSSNKDKPTYIGDRKNVKSTLDYIISRTSLKCRIEHRCRGFSDHAIVIGILGIGKSSRRRRKKKGPVLERTWLQDEDGANKEKYQKALEQFGGETKDWNQLAEKLTKVAAEVIPRREKVRRNNWVTEQILELIKKRRILKDKNELKSLNAEIQRQCRRAKMAEVTEHSRRVEELEGKNRIREMYQIVRKLGWKKSVSSSKFLVDNDGNKLTEEEDKKRRWKDYMNELYKNMGKNVRMSDKKVSESLPSEEIQRAIRSAKNNKATGEDNIPIELIKNADDGTVEDFVEIVKSIYNGDEIPKQWLTTLFVPIPKKKNTPRCDEHRTIALIPHGMKVLTKVITNRISGALIDQLDDNQFGFRANRGTLEGVACLKTILGNRINMGEETYLCFIDFKKAFDRVDHAKLIEILRERSVPEREVQLLSEMYTRQEGFMKADDRKEYPIEIGRGVRQGCAISPILYNTYADHMMKKAKIGGGIIVDHRIVNRIAYADDTVLVADSMSALNEMISRVIITGKEYGIEINNDKTKVMKVKKKGHDDIKSIHGFQQVAQFQYLGIPIGENMQHDKDIRAAIEKARAAFWANGELMRHNLSIRVKLKLLDSQVFSIVKYCAEAFVLTKVLKKKINSFTMWCYRRMLRISWTEMVRNDDVLRRIGREESYLVKLIVERKCVYLGHVARGSAGETLKSLCLEETKVGKGARRRRWTDDLEVLCDNRIKRFVYRSIGAEDRNEWRKKIRGMFPK